MRTNTKRWLQKASIIKMAPVIALAGVPYFAAGQEGMKLEEVLVTATRRTQTDAQSTPVALTQISSEQIQKMAPRDLLDIAALAPNVAAGKQPGFNSANFAIRGVGQNGIIVYYENQVGVTVDDFVIPHIQTANIEMLDIEAIEILRGPQGTLFGKNTTGGVINVKTNKPQLGENTADISAKLAEYGRRELKGVFNLALSDTFAIRAAALQMESDGIYKLGAEYGPVVAAESYPFTGDTGQGDGSRYGGDDVLSGRFKARWQPSDAIDVNLTYEMVRDRGDAPPSMSTTPDGAYAFNGLGFTSDSGDPLDRAAISGRNDVLIGMNKGHRIDVDGFYLNIDWAINDDYSVAMFGGYRETDSWLPSTYTGESGPVSLFDANRQDVRETSQFEVRVVSDLDGPFNWVAGAFYQDDETLFSVAQVLGFVDMTLDSDAIFGDPLFFNNNPQVLSNGQDASAAALFWDGTWNVNDKLTLGAGARYTREKKSWTGRHQMFVFGLDPDLTWQELGEPLGAADFGRYPVGVVEDSETWKEPTWRFSAGYQASDDLYLYSTYSRGFKSGTYNDQTGTGGNPIEPVQARPTDPETADSFEIGLRSEFFDNRVRINLTAFSVVYDDSQQQLLATIDVVRGGEESTFQETRFFNAAKIEVSGFEFEGAWLVTDKLTLQGSIGTLDAEFDSFEADTTFDGVIDTDLSGNPVARSPELMWNIDANYLVPMSAGALDLSLNVNYEDEAVYAYTSVPDTADGMTDERTLVNLSATFTSNDDSWWVRAYAKNITDERYRIGDLPVANLWVMGYFGEPRTIGVEGGMRFSW